MVQRIDEVRIDVRKKKRTTTTVAVNCHPAFKNWHIVNAQKAHRLPEVTPVGKDSNAVKDAGEQSNVTLKASAATFHGQAILVYLNSHLLSFHSNPFRKKQHKGCYTSGQVRSRVEL